MGELIVSISGIADRTLDAVAAFRADLAARDVPVSLMVAPRRDAKRKASLVGKRGGFPITPDTIAVKRLLSCNGTWVEADTEFGIGWVERVCARQLGSC